MAPNLRIKDWSVEERPREKMIINGASSLTNSELLAILIRTGNKNETAVDIAKRLLSKGENSLQTLSRLGMEQMCEIGGLGVSKATTILALFELARRFTSEPKGESPQILSAADAVRAIGSVLKHLDHEELWGLYLNKANKVIHRECLSKGGIDSTVIDYRIILKRGVDKLATGLIIFHNHPSGNPYPGANDIKFTRTLKETSSLLEISLIDHIIIAGEKYYSFSEESKI